jgi:hypothetical protein
MVAVKQPQQRRMTAAQLILLAGDDLVAAGSREFNEWQLTVAAWKREPGRFGLRGFEQTYPDHKRVMSEIMGKKPNSPVVLGYLEKVRPNVYKVTALGRSEAARLRSGGAAKATKDKDPYTRLAPYVTHRAFVRWRNDPEQPRQWADVEDFLAAGSDAPGDVPAQVDYLRRAIRTGLDHCRSKELLKLEAPTKGGAAILIHDLADLNDFLHALQYRFPEELEEKATARRK